MGRRGGWGFSLVELMVALLLGVIVMISVLSVFLSTNVASRSTSGVAALTDKGRFALDALQQAVRNAGFLSCSAPKNPDAVSSYEGDVTRGAPTDFSQALGGYEYANTSFANTLSDKPYALPAVPILDTALGDWKGLNGANADAVLTNPKNLPIQGSDVLIVRENLPQSTFYYLVNDAPASQSSVVLNVDASAVLKAGLKVVLSNCVSTAVMKVDHASGQTVYFSTNLPFQFEMGSQLALVDAVIYYVGQSQSPNATGSAANDNSSVGLFAYSIGSDTSWEVVPDIENMQILYGVDTNGAGVVTQYVTADQVYGTSYTQDFRGVLSVRIGVLAASPPNVIPSNQVGNGGPYKVADTWVHVIPDDRLHRPFEITVYLRNNGA